MAVLHDKLKSLGPVSFSSVPTSTPELSSYLQSHFSDGQFIIESIPQPNPPAAAKTRARATSSASAVSDISLSSARSKTPSEEHEALQKEWGKPVKLSEKENPLGISVYKLSAKDGKGAWFARRSVHEGLSFERWKEGLIQEFPSSLKVEGGPGSGKVRGIAADTRPERVDVNGVGSIEVYHLSAQFPGPSAPRDFVTLLLTSDSALVGAVEDRPRHYMVISKPCEHPDYPAKNGLVRGTYESLEFIREIPRDRKAASTTDLLKRETKPKDDSTAEAPETTRRSRGKTVSFAESRGMEAKGEMIDRQTGAEDSDEDANPVEWIMITRSDPGGSVPRFLVERGTPSGIVSDASKFLDWACKRGPLAPPESSEELEEASTPRPGIAVMSTEEQIAQNEREQPIPPAESQSLLSTAANAAYTAAEAYAPALTNGLSNAAHSALPGGSETPINSTTSTDPSRKSSVSSDGSFASAEEDFSDAGSLPSTASGSTRALSAQEKELLRLANRKSELAAKLVRTKEKSIVDRDKPTEKELSRVKKAKEKHDREVSKAEERYAKATKQIEDKRRRDESREEERKEREVKQEVERRQKAEKKEREQREKAEKKDAEARLKTEVEGLKKEVEKLKGEKGELDESVRVLQAENTKLVTMMGKLEGGERLLGEMKGESEPPES
ncbi:MAG: hypothetical protein LQ340_002649 [Diploschistes diacapsis]|nr:MAG: hypothetical protein LQ340_002649 [Diploschistes diacapsis]